MTGKINVLGRGLSALIEDAENHKTEPGFNYNIPVSKIENNPFQPRKEFDEESILSLAESIKSFGVIQPVTVRRKAKNKFQLISGERRLRAAIIAGLKEIPAFIRETDDQGMLEVAIVENIQREDLNPIEIALCYKRLIEECNLTQEKMSERFGKQRSTISNYLRLLKLPPEIQAGITKKAVTMGHARALINIDNLDKQLQVYNRVILNDLSVRQTEEIVRTLNNQAIIPLHKNKYNSETAGLKEMLKSRFNCRVDLKKSVNGRGRISLIFSNENEFNSIVNNLIGK